MRREKKFVFVAGIYLHIPFCKRRCLYCDFFSSTSPEWKERYVAALCRELEQRQDYLEGAPVHTIYLGGGTPSQLSPAELERIFHHIYKVYPVAEGAEVTLEANPDDLTEAYVSALRALPVNRLSMGVQTFDDERLRFLHRRHTARQAQEAVERLHTAGFDNLSIDLIYGLPGETLSEWEHDIRQALALGASHLSAYSLTYEEGTPLWQLRARGEVEEADEELSARMYERLVALLTAEGYEHYEISNFCLPHRASRHNSSYWQGIPYLGCGAAAHSFNGHSRQWNIASIPYYIKGINENAPQIEREELDLTTRYNDCLVTSLRTAWGISVNTLRQEFGDTLCDYCLRLARPHITRRHLELTADGTLRLTSRGIFVSDGIISDLLWVE